MTRHKLKRRNKTHKQKIKRGKSRKVKQSRKLKQSRKYKQSRKCKHNKKYNKTKKLKQIHNEKIDEYKLVLNEIYKMQKLKSSKKIKNKKFVGGGAIKQIFVKVPQMFPNFSETPEQLAKVIISSTKCGLKDKFKGKTFNEVYNCVKEEYNELGQAKAASAGGKPAGDGDSGLAGVAPGGPAGTIPGAGGIPNLGPGAGKLGAGIAGIAGPAAISNLAALGAGGIVPGGIVPGGIVPGGIPNLGPAAGVAPGAAGKLGAALAGAAAGKLGAAAGKLGAAAGPAAIPQTK